MSPNAGRRQSASALAAFRVALAGGHLALVLTVSGPLCARPPASRPLVVSASLGPRPMPRTARSIDPVARRRDPPAADHFRSSWLRSRYLFGRRPLSRKIAAVTLPSCASSFSFPARRQLPERLLERLHVPGIFLQPVVVANTYISTF